MNNKLTITTWLNNLYVRYQYEENPNSKVYKHYEEGIDLNVVPMTKSKESFKRYCRRFYNKLKKSGYTKLDLSKANDVNENFSSEYHENELEVNINTTKDTPFDDLLRKFNIDLDNWIITHKKLNSWDSPYKDPDTGILESKKMYQVKVNLIKKVPDEQKIPVINKIKYNLPKVPYNNNKCIDSLKKTLLFCDAHIGFRKSFESDKLEPFHDRRSLDIILQVSKNYQPDEIVILGDMLDCNELGKFLKEPEFYFTFQPALNEFGFILASLRSNCPDAKIIITSSNHTDRLRKMIIENFTFAYNLKAFKKETPLLSLKNLLSLDDLNIEIQEDYPNDGYWINKQLKAIHGEFVNPKKNIESNNFSVIAGHLHKEFVETKTLTCFNDKKKFVKIISLPATCRNDGFVPGNTSNPNWQKGFGIVESFNDNYFNSFIYLVQDDDICFFQNKLYHGNDYSEILKSEGVL